MLLLYCKYGNPYPQGCGRIKIFLFGEKEDGHDGQNNGIYDGKNE